MAAKKTMRHASALKAHRQSLVRRAYNTQVRSEVRTLTAKVLKEIQSKNAAGAKESFKLAQSAWQKAAKRGIFNKSTASRKISRLALHLAGLAKS